MKRASSRLDAALIVTAGVLTMAGALAWPAPAEAQSSLPTRPGLATRAPNALQRPGGTVAGHIFWDEERVAYSPSVPCQDLQVELNAITGTGVQKLATTDQLQPIQTERHGPALGLCAYSFTRVPEGVALQVQVIVGGPFASRVGSTGPFGAVGGLIKIPGGQCQNPRTDTTPSSTYLEAGWVGCGEHAYNVNFQLVPRNSRATLPPQNTTLLHQSAGANPPSKPMLLQPNAQPTPPASSGMLVPPVRPALVAQPAASTAGGFTGGIKPNATVRSAAGANKPGTIGPQSPMDANLITNPAAGIDPAIIALLQREKAVALAESGRASSPTAQRSSDRVAQAPRRGVTLAAPLSLPPGSTPLADRARTAPTNNALTCATSKTPVIQSISGQPGSTAVFTQDPDYNLYTIKGCNFGTAWGGVDLQLTTLFSSGSVPAQDLTIEAWTDNLITVTVPRIFDTGDQGNVTLTVYADKRPPAKQPGLRFYSERQSVLLTQIPTSSVYLRPINDSSGHPVNAQYSTPYHGLGYTASVQSDTIVSSNDFNKNFPSSDQGWTAGVDRNATNRFSGGTDVFDFSKLLPGFVVEEYAIDGHNMPLCITGDDSDGYLKFRNVVFGALENYQVPGITIYSDGGWDSRIDGRTIRVDWAEKHCHGTGGTDSSNSSYAIQVSVVGPILSSDVSVWQQAGSH